jgi:uncharacterized repeat protein (TIGR01451 family)
MRTSRNRHPTGSGVRGRAFAGTAGRVRLLVVAILVGLAALSLTQPAASFTDGHVFVSVSNGLVNEYLPDGTFVRSLDTTKGSGTFTTGLGFDTSGNLYVTDFNAQDVSKFDPTGTLLGSFGSGYNTNPESILFDAAGNAYVGQANGTGDILKFDSAGSSLGSFDPAIEDRGTDWIDLASDQCTMHYTSEGTSVKTFDVCTNTQGPDFATGLPGSVAYAHRILPDGGELVADTESIVRLNSAGAVIQTYDAAGQDSWFALNLDPDKTSFWSADFTTSMVFHFDIATGAVLGSFSTGTASNTVFGLAVKGELTAATYHLDLQPKTATNDVGTSHTVTATLTLNGVAQSGQTIDFSVSGANTASGSALTNASGEATFTYTGANAGTDTITATYSKNGNVLATDTAEKTWIVRNADLSITKTGPAFAQSGGTITYSISVGNGGPADATGVTVSDPLPAGETLVSATPSQGTCSGSVTCNLGSIANGGSATITIVANVTAACGATLTNTATVSGDQPDPNTANNTSSTAAFVFCVVAGGNFVIGDQNAAVGSSVTFWGAKWSKLNDLSGGSAPASFKGFETTPAAVTCGTNWTAPSGNSARPPAGPLPSFMAVIVASSISKHGSTISGNTVHMVVVQTNPGYAPNPGHAGTGTVIGQIC